MAWQFAGSHASPHSGSQRRRSGPGKKDKDGADDAKQPKSVAEVSAENKIIYPHRPHR